MEAAASQLLRAMRGKRSQVAFARRLGYRANPITDWENGRRYPTAAETMRAGERAGIDVDVAFRRFHPAPAPNPATDAQALAAWLSHLRGSTPVAQLANRIQRSRFSVSRWLSGQAQPRLPDFMRMVDALTGRVPDLVAELVPIEAVPDLLARHRTAAAARRLAFEAPWTEAVLRLLETDDYRRAPHADAWLAARLAIPETLVASTIAQLATADIIVRAGDHYRVAGALTVDTRTDPQAMRSLMTHWSQVALARYGDRPDDDLFAYNVMSVSHTDLARIRELLRTTFREIRTIVANSEPAETAALLNLQLIGWTAPEDAREGP